jgi:hypothetical protein
MLGETTYRVRQRVRQTGLYRVIHYQHRMRHEAMMRQGERFPACNKYGSRVAFRLSSTAEPVISDRDFMDQAA